MKLETHRIHVLHTDQISFPKGLGCRICDLVSPAVNDDLSTPAPEKRDLEPVPPCLPVRLHKGARSAKGNQQLFERVTIEEAVELLPNIHGLLSGKYEKRCIVYRLTNPAKLLLNTGMLYTRRTPRNEKRGHRLALHLSAAALNRLEASVPQHEFEKLAHLITVGDNSKKRLIIPIQIDQVQAHLFSTDRLITRFSFFADLPPDFGVTETLLGEMADLAGRFAELVWIDAPLESEHETTTKTPSQQVTIAHRGGSIGSLIARMLRGVNAKSQIRHRVFTYAFAKVSGEEPDPGHSKLLHTSQMLARQFTSDYAILENADLGKCVTEFENVATVIAREGAATLVYPKTKGVSVSYLEGFGTKPVEATYIPLIILNLHQLSQFLTIGLSFYNDQSIFDPDHNINERDRDQKGVHAKQVQSDRISALEKEQSRLTKLKAGFRFHHVSQVTTHNKINLAARRAFELDEMDRELGSILTEISERIQSATKIGELRSRENFEKIYGWIPPVLLASTTAFFTLETSAIIQSFRKDGLDQYETSSFLVAAAAAVVAFGWYFINKKGVKN